MHNAIHMSHYNFIRLDELCSIIVALEKLCIIYIFARLKDIIIICWQWDLLMAISITAYVWLYRMSNWRHLSSLYLHEIIEYQKEVRMGIIWCTSFDWNFKWLLQQNLVYTHRILKRRLPFFLCKQTHQKAICRSLDYKSVNTTNQ